MAIIPLPQVGMISGCGGDTPSQSGIDGAAVPSRGVGSDGNDSIERVPAREASAPCDEAELARRLTEDDVSALTVVSEWLWEPLAAYAFRIVGDPDAASDIAQEACVRLWEARRSTQVKSIRSYLFRVTRNLALDHVRTRRTRRRLLKLHRHVADRYHPPAPDEELERNRVTETVQCAIQALPERRREVFSLTYLRGLSYADVAEVMGISPKTVQNQMIAALAQLRSALRPLIQKMRERSGPGGSGTEAG